MPYAELSHSGMARLRRKTENKSATAPLPEVRLLESGSIQIESHASANEGGNYGEKRCENERAQSTLRPCRLKQSKSVAAESNYNWQNENGDIRISPWGMRHRSGAIAEPSENSLRDKDRNDCDDGPLHF